MLVVRFLLNWFQPSKPMMRVRPGMVQVVLGSLRLVNQELLRQWEDYSGHVLFPCSARKQEHRRG